MTRADLPVARDLASQLATFAAGTDDAAIRLHAHNAQGMVAFYSGDFVGALAELERGMAIYEPVAHSPTRSPAFWGGHDTGFSCAGQAARALWLLGDEEGATKRMAEALAWARAVDHPFTLAYANSFAAIFHASRHEPDAAKPLAEEAMRLSSEHGFALFASLDALHRGCQEDDAAAMAAGIAAYRAMGSLFGLPTHLALLAESHARHGRSPEGLAVIDDACAIAEATGAHYNDAELERVRGVLLGASAPDAAEAAFRRAIDIARSQHATTLERRAAADLAALAR
jgi:adenylate cyclase